MRIKLRQVEGFLAAAETLSFSRAAEKIGMTQPAFSQLIRDLENTLEVKLFERSTRRVRITATGAQLRDQMRRGVLEIDNACNNARALTRLEAGQMSVAILPSLALGLVAGSLSTFHQTYPNVKVHLREARSPYVLDAVRGYDADFAICARFATSEQMSCDYLFDDELVAVLPRQHPLLAKRTLGWGALACEALILLAAQAESIKHAFAQNGIDKAGDYDVLNSATALSMVRAGFGVTVAPLIALPSLNMHGLAYRRLSAPRLVREICLYHRIDGTLSPAAGLFRRMLLAEYATTAPQR